MTSPLVPLAEFARLVAREQHRVLPLDEVAELTGFSLRWIETECRADRLDHTQKGHTRGMTLAQVDQLVASRRRGRTEVTASAVQISGRAAAIEASKRSANRGSRRMDVA
ncbi:hypothetical protein [Paractinoplanes toevensis]|uniref:Helix-turn-helix domain-containing protein n=1 Tax=Paractinoplanes toevensis TaxID=571911 RepID=A0A919T7N5_9ACTN|nr:hypothetical protein [Actinoplanes toevensis]GIM90358.1 hypothetical protein Ato02nite_021510 [Actinoplanes toevensis]